MIFGTGLGIVPPPPPPPPPPAPKPIPPPVPTQPPPPPHPSHSLFESTGAKIGLAAVLVGGVGYVFYRHKTTGKWF